MNHSYRICFPPIFFFIIKPYFARAQLVRFYHVVGHLINVCVEFYCVARFLSMTWNPRTLQFHNKTKKKQTNNTNTEIWQHVDDTTIPEPVAKNQGNMIQDSVNK